MQFFNTKRLMAFATAIFMTLSLVVTAPMTVLANDEIGVTINGQSVDFPGGQGAVIVDGRTLVPVRGVFETLGFEVDWDGTTQTAIITSADYELRITIGNDVFTVNGVPVPSSLDVPAQNIGGRTMVPIRLPLEAVGFDLDWDGVTRTVIISTPLPIPSPAPELTPTPTPTPEPVEEVEEQEELSPEESLRAEVANAGNEPTVIYLTEDITLMEIEEALIIPSGSDITLRSSTGTHTLSAGGNFHVIYVESGGTLTIYGINISRTSGTRGRGVQNGGHLTLVSGVISGHHPQETTPDGGGEASSWGAGVNMWDGATFVMQGGEISNNTADSGVAVSNWNSTFTMTGGIISNNTGRWSGGVSNGGGGTFTMNGGTITNNTNGGVNNNSTFTMTDGEISNNTREHGAGVWNGGTFTMNGGTITNNTATGNGGGVNNSGESAVFNMSGGEISDNNARWGGGVGTWQGTFTMTNGTISGNTSEESGGGVSNGENSTFTISGGSITGNHAGTWGGGVMTWGADRVFNNDGGTIEGNTADSGAEEISEGS